MVERRGSDIDLASLVDVYATPRPIDWPYIFRREGPLVVEIGAGLGEFLLRLNEQNPGWNLVGIEQEWERVKKTLRKLRLLKRGLGEGASPVSIRLLRIDATVALERLFSPQSIDRAFCLFPCPWPKKGHVKHRLFSPGFLRLLNSRLRPEGELLLVTDSWPYHEWVLEQLPGTGFRAAPRTAAPRFGTKYERKWQARGQNIFYEIGLRKEVHVDIPALEDRELKVHFVEHFDAQRFRFTDLVSGTTVAMKETLFDPQANKAMLRFIVAEKTITQHLWVSVSRGAKGWRVAKADGQSVIPTEGLAVAIDYLCQQIRQSCSLPEGTSTDIPSDET